MKEAHQPSHDTTPILVPFTPEEFWATLRTIIHEEIQSIQKEEKKPVSFDVPGLTEKPLYKIAEVCALFQITKPTVYDWIKHGKLKPLRVRSRVYFLWQDIKQLLHQNAA